MMDFEQFGSAKRRGPRKSKKSKSKKSKSKRSGKSRKGSHLRYILYKPSSSLTVVLNSSSPISSSLPLQSPSTLLHYSSTTHQQSRPYSHGIP